MSTSKLKFKGDKTTKKKRKRPSDDDHAHNTTQDNDPNTWVPPDDPLQIRGPTFIYHPSDPSPICLTFDSTRNRIVLHTIDKETPTDNPESLLERTPTDVSQVWITTR